LDGFGVGLGLVSPCFGVGLGFESAQVLATLRLSPIPTSSVAQIFVIGFKTANRFFINQLLFVAAGQIQPRT
jgi:hypothetical protein